MASERWFIARNKEKVGPFSASDLKQLARHGVLRTDEHVWLQGAGKWIEAGSLPGLFPQAGEKKYWVSLAGQARGPFVAAQVRAGLNAHQFGLETQACADDVRQWMPLGRLPEFSDFKFETVALTPSRAQVMVSALEFDEAAIHLAGKSGDATAKLISTLLDMKRNCANNPGLVESLEATVAILRARREENEHLIPPAPRPAS
jgi:hypothetical protein